MERTVHLPTLMNYTPTYFLQCKTSINKVLDAFSVLLPLMSRMFTKSPALIENLLGLRSGDLNITLIDLHSILDKPRLRILYRQPWSVIFVFLKRFQILRNYLPCCLLQKFQLSTTIFTMHCARSYPTAELLDALWSSNILAFWPVFFFAGIFFEVL